MGTARTEQVLQRLQDLEIVVVEQLDRALLEVHRGVVLCWTRWMTSIGQVVETHGLWKLDVWYGSGTAWANWSFFVKSYDGVQSAVVRRRFE